MEEFGRQILAFLNFILPGINWELIYSQRVNLYEGATLTLGISVAAVGIGVTLGLVVAIARLSKRWWFRIPASIYVEAFRGTPMVVQMLLLWYGIFPFFDSNVFPFFGLTRVEAVWAGITALGLNSAAYLGEIFRGGIQSIDKGQREAALSLGMGEYQVMRYVILPQALANAIPAIGNEFVTMIKDTSLVAFIAVSELTYRAMLVAARKYEYFTMYVGIAIVYFIMTFTTSRLLALLERRLRVGQTAAEQTVARKTARSAGKRAKASEKEGDGA